MRICWKANCSGTKKGHSLEQTSSGAEGLSWRTAEPFFSMRSVMFLLRHKSKCCACCRSSSSKRVGGTESVQVDVRVIGATNRNLEEQIKQGAFREDLFYRLNVVTIQIPPLRSRRDDIPPALEHFLHLYATEQQRTTLSFSKEAWDLLLRYHYPGNMRELDNIVQRAVILSSREVISTNELPQVVKRLEKENGAAFLTRSESLPKQVERLEKELVMEALRVTNGNQSKAADRLEISERNLRYRLKKWGVK